MAAGDQGFQPQSQGSQARNESPSGAAGSNGSAQVVAGSLPSNIASAHLGQKEFREDVMRQAVAAGDDEMVRTLRTVISAADRKRKGRDTDLYAQITHAMQLERAAKMSAKTRPGSEGAR